MLVSLDNFRDASGHVHITGTVGVVPVKVHFKELLAFPVDGYILIVLFKDVEEMLGVFSPNIFYTKIVNAQSKCNGSFCV